MAVRLVNTALREAEEGHRNGEPGAQEAGGQDASQTPELRAVRRTRAGASGVKRERKAAAFLLSPASESAGCPRSVGSTPRRPPGRA